MAYTKQQFEAYFQLMSALSHQIIKIDFEEMRNWVDKIVGPDSIHSEQRMEDLTNLQHVIGAFTQMQGIIRQHGVPVRDPRNAGQVEPASPETTPKLINPGP